MSLAAQQEVIRAAVVTCTALADQDVYWMHQREANAWKGDALAELRLGVVLGAGIDETRTTYTATPTPSREVSQVGNRRATISVRIETDTQVPGEDAQTYAARLRLRLRRPAVLAALRAGGVALASIERTIPADYVDDGRMVSLAITDVVFLLEAIDVDPVADTGDWIDDAAGEATISGNPAIDF